MNGGAGRYQGRRIGPLSYSGGETSGQTVAVTEWVGLQVYSEGASARFPKMTEGCGPWMEG